MTPQEKEQAIYDYDPDWNLSVEQIEARDKELEEKYQHLPMEDD